MGQNVLVDRYLSREMIEAGAETLRRLDSAKVAIKAAYWMYRVEPGRWRLVLASPDYNKIGPTKTIEKIQLALENIKEEDGIVTLWDISVVDSTDSIVKAMKKALKKRKDVSVTRLTDTYIDGHYIDDAYIYRMN